jgi:hypothetical protein
VARPIDPTFDPDEKLWRRIEKKTVDKATRALKPNTFRPQVSVVRARYGTPDHVCQGKWNGIAEAAAGDVTKIKINPARVECVHEPVDDTDKGYSHTLVALVLTPGDDAPTDVVNKVRDEYCRAFKVTLDPT